jgi:hypothetical protein
MGKLLISAVLMLVASGNAVAADNGSGDQVPAPPQSPSHSAEITVKATESPRVLPANPCPNRTSAAFYQSDMGKALPGAFPAVICAGEPPPLSDAAVTIIRNLKGVDYKVMRDGHGGRGA